MDERQTVSDAGEPLLTRTVEVGSHGSNGSLKHTIPKTAVDLLDLTDADSVTVDIYQNGYVVRKEGNDEC